MEATLVAVVIILWLAVSGRLAKAWSVLAGAAPAAVSNLTGAPTSNTSNQTPSVIHDSVGWAPLDGRVFDPNPNSTFSDIRGNPISQVPGATTGEEYRNGA